MTGLTTPTPAGSSHAGLDATGLRILEAASRAASSHNIQPWIVEVEGPGQWILCADPARRLPAVDPDNREPLLSIGAFVENLSVAAGAMGFEAGVEFLTNDRFAHALARVTLRRGRPSGVPLESLAGRRTLRSGFLDHPISQAHVSTLLARFHGHARFFGHDSVEGRFLREGTLAAFRHQSWRDAAQAELAGWIRFRPEEAARKGDGLTPATMEVGGVGGWLLRTFYDQARVMTPAFRERGIRGVAEQVDQAGGWIVAWSADLSAPSLIETGRRLQGMLLAVRGMGIAVHPMTQMVQEAPWRERLAETLALPGAPQLVLRVGYVDAYPAPVSLRRPVADFVVPVGGV